MGTDNQTSQENTQATEEKTFTQAEVNSFLKREEEKIKAKYADYADLQAKASKLDELEEANKSALEKANEKAAKLQTELDGIKKASALREMREKIATDNNIPVELLTGATEEECTKQVETIKTLLNAQGIPTAVRDGGEVVNTGKLSTRTQFAQWAKQNWN